ncbi:hypothetical protein ACIRPH_16890 [Nocardiopsis sp. NPDC101807]|uniref:TPR repeat region-containing protein n=1 Tax=Nocardiopsis sp. NPDC101807 TaxID=3364339 RepID=UPI0038165D42
MSVFTIGFTQDKIDDYTHTADSLKEEFEVLEARLLGRANDLSGSFDSAAQQFTDIIAWNISFAGQEDYQLWVDASTNIRFLVGVADRWSECIQDFWDEYNAIYEAWREAKSSAEGRVPEGITYISAHNPERSLIDWDANRARDLYDELSETRSSLRERARLNMSRHEERAEEIATMLSEGPTEINVQKLVDGGNADWGFASINPSEYLDINQDLTPESAEETAEELAPYWSGDKPLDDRYHELMLTLSMISLNARHSQNEGERLDNETIDFLETFYTQLELEGGGSQAGVLSVPGWMEGGHMTDEEREHALGMLGDGLLVLSDNELGGGYELLPESVRTASEGPFLSTDPNDPVYHMSTYQEDAQALAQFLSHTSDELEGGYTLSTNLTMSTGSYNYFWGSQVEGGWLTSEELAALVDVGTRNEDSNYYVLTGDHPQPVPELGLDHHDSFREQAVQGLLSYEWHDQGATARQLTNWIAEDFTSTDEEKVIRAGNGFAGFMEIMTDPDVYEALTKTGVNVTEGENDYADASFTQFNGELADSLADVFDAHIYSFANGDIYDIEREPVEGIGQYEHDTGLVQMGPQERAMYMQYLMGNDESAGHVVNSVDFYQQIESIAYLESGDSPSSARGTGQLQALLEQALEMESQKRTEDLDYQIERRTQIADFIVGEAGSLSEKIPVIGTAVAKGMELGQESIVQAIIDGEYEVSPRFPTYTTDEHIERTFSLETFDFVSRTHPGELNKITDLDDLRTLVDGGALTIENNGGPVDSDDIDDDFFFDDSVTLRIEKDPSEWSANEMVELDTMDSAIRNVLKKVDITVGDEEASGASYVAEFVPDYTGAYNATRDFFASQAPEEEAN